MNYEVKPIKNFKCAVRVPGSKSITNRVLIIGALAEGKTVFKNVLFSDDTVYMLEALKEMGIPIKVEKEEGMIEITGGGRISASGECFIGNAGTAMRFLSTLIAVKGGEVELTGVERMKNRPIGELVDALKQLGLDIIYKENEGYPPIRIKSKGLNGGNIKIKGNISSQFISSIILSAPYAYSDIGIEIEGELVSKPYIDITIGVMKDFGVKVENHKYRSFYIKAGQRYKSRKYTVEADCSSASYFFAAAAIAKGDITVENINPYSLQGDIGFLNILEEMGAKVERGKNYVRVIGDKLKGISTDMGDISDTAQTLAVTALFAEGPTEIKNVYNMRLKETDRLKALANELAKLGARVVEKEDGIVIYPPEVFKGADIETYDDHRMAMSFTLSGLIIPEIRIKNSQCVSKTFPDFFKEFEKLYL